MSSIQIPSSPPIKLLKSKIKLCCLVVETRQVYNYNNSINKLVGY